MKHKLTLIMVVQLVFCTPNSHADLPLTVENLISDKGKISINTELVYGNSKSNQAQITGVIPIQIGNNSYINLPTNISNSRNQSEYLVSAIGLKYGIGKNSDIGINISGSHQSQHNLNTNDKYSDSQFNDLSLTGSYQFLDDGKYPALVGFYDISVLEKQAEKNIYFSNLSAGVTTYKSYDPIVLSLTTGYKYNFEKSINNQTTKPSDIFFINPQVAFAANEKISLLAGATFRHIGSQQQNKETINPSRNDTDISFGVGYGLNNDANLNFTTTLKQGFDNTQEFRLSYSKKFK